MAQSLVRLDKLDDLTALVRFRKWMSTKDVFYLHNNDHGDFQIPADAYAQLLVSLRRTTPLTAGTFDNMCHM